MLARLVEFSLTQRLLVLVLTALLVGAGVMAFRGLPIDAFPDVSSTQVKIIIKSPGMTPGEVEARITVPLEQELLGIPNQRVVRAVSKYGLTDITIDFTDGTDIYWARQQVAERLAGAMANLPGTASGGLAPITTPLGEMFMFTVEGPLSLAERRTLLDWVIRPQLRTIPGVADVNSLGGHALSFEVVPNPQLLAARGLTLEDLQEALQRNNRNDGAGRLGDGEEALIVRAEGAIRNLEDLADVVVASPGGVPVRVEDVAGVRMGSLIRTDAGFAAYPMGKSSGAVTGFSNADGYICIGAQTELVPAGTSVAVHLLSRRLSPADFVSIGSHCLGLDYLLQHLQAEGFATKALQVGSQGGLAAARRGECDVAGIHLMDPQSGEYNAPFLGEETALVKGYTRMQGVAFRKNDPRFKDAATPQEAVAAALSDLQCAMVNRNAGSGTRVLIDQLLGESQPPGYAVQAKSHNAVAAAIAQGRADWGMTIAPVARDYGLGFLPLKEEHYDFAIPRSRLERPAVRRFIALLQEPAVRDGLARLGFQTA